jgi:hypothetical protein
MTALCKKVAVNDAYLRGAKSMLRAKHLLTPRYFSTGHPSGIAIPFSAIRITVDM